MRVAKQACLQLAEEAAAFSSTESARVEGLIRHMAMATAVGVVEIVWPILDTQE